MKFIDLQSATFEALLEALCSAAVRDDNEREKQVKNEIVIRLVEARKYLNASNENCGCLYFNGEDIARKLV